MQKRALVLVLGLCGLWLFPQLAMSQQQSLICKFHVGPRAGSTIDFTGVRGARAGPLGAPCQDGLGSSGILVASMSAPNQGSVRPGFNGNSSTTCRFVFGPRAGQIINFEGVPGARPGQVGTPCNDGLGSTGEIVPPSTPGAKRFGATDSGQAPRMSFTCRFTHGPRAGHTINFEGVAGARPAPIGTPCQDGAGSYGTTIR